MKPVLKGLDGHWTKYFYNGTVLVSYARYSQEYVDPGTTLRNDPKFRKTPGRWRYKVVNDVMLHNDEEDPKEWNYRQVYVLTGQVIMKAVGVHGGLIPDPTPEEYDFNSVANQALSRLNDSVRGNLDLSIALAESGKTAKMIANLGKFVKFARSKRPKGGFVVPKTPPLTRNSSSPKGVISRGIGHHANDASQAIANGYLEFKYGWKPLMSDIFGVADESIRYTMNQLQKFKASAKMPVVLDKMTPIGIEAIGAAPMHIRSDGGKKCVRYQMALKIPDSSFDIARWTSLNPLSIGWELIPYSFVVDWFVNVGSYLRNIETALYYNVLYQYGFKTEFVYLPMVAEIKNYSAFISGYKCEVQGLSAQKLFISLNRVPMTSYPTPSLPRFTADLGASQLTSAAALLRQLLRRA